MSYFFLIIVGFVGIVLGVLAVHGKVQLPKLHPTSRNKKNRKQKIIEFLAGQERVKNDDVERILGVSNATAERYLNELEGEGKLVQHGTRGRGVFYTLKDALK